MAKPDSSTVAKQSSKLASSGAEILNKDVNFRSMKLPTLLLAVV
jgi:hypothetical protein